MKIAIIGSFGSKIPLMKNKIHAPLLLTYNLAIELAKMGHQITYFGSYEAGKVFQHKNIKYNNLNYQPLPVGLQDQISSAEIWHQLKLIYEQGYLAKIFKQNDFDVFYSWSAYRTGPLACLTEKPVVLTHHDSTNMQAYNLMFKSFNRDNVFMIPVSNYMKGQIRNIKKLKVVHHGLDIEKINFYSQPENYFCWIGRVVPSKGLHIAIKLAKKLNFKLKYAGPINDSFGDFGEIVDYAEFIKNETKNSSNIEYLGILDQQQSYNLISKSKALIFPTDGTESFSLVTAESIVAGVPVISFAKGPVPELIDNKKTGFLCHNIAEMEVAIKNIGMINRKNCRAIGVKKFDQKLMAERYAQRFSEAIKLTKNYNR